MEREIADHMEVNRAGNTKTFHAWVTVRTSYSCCWNLRRDCNLMRIMT